MSNPVNLKEEAEIYIGMVYPEGVEEGTDQRLDIEAAFHAGALRALSMVQEGGTAAVRAITQQAEHFVEAGIAKEMARNKRN